jgi:hypothetical protein
MTALRLTKDILEFPFSTTFNQSGEISTGHEFVHQGAIESVFLMAIIRLSYKHSIRRRSNGGPKFFLRRPVDYAFFARRDPWHGLNLDFQI